MNRIALLTITTLVTATGCTPDEAGEVLAFLLAVALGFAGFGSYDGGCGIVCPSPF